jgi:hypothetical protein
VRAARSLQEALDRALGDAGVGRPRHTTPLEHAKDLVARGFPAAELVTSVTARTLAARFGGEVLGGAEIASLRAKIAEVKRARPSS